MIGGISGGAQYYGYYQYPGVTGGSAVQGSAAWSSTVQSGAVQDSARAQEAQSAQQTQLQGGVLAVKRGADPETPVEPVQASPVVKTGTSNTIPFLRKGADPTEMAVRMRIQYPQEEQAEEPVGAEAVQRAYEEGECQTCKERKYQDGSDDPGVSYQTPTHIAPEQAASAVRGHEMEHVVRESAEADREDREVVSQSVTIHTDICPECGRVYISGGTTRTVTAAKTQPYADTSENQDGELFSAVA